jgi:uncharacterized membrane protein YphA (DoxX/SURF4 family)
MLNLFPDLLYLSFFAPTLLRIAAGGLFAYVAWQHYEKRAELAQISYPLVGSGALWVWLSILWLSATAAMLILGIYTQIAALMAMVAALKFFQWSSRFPELTVLSWPSRMLLFVICLTLLITGAGAYAVDIPL